MEPYSKKNLSVGWNAVFLTKIESTNVIYMKIACELGETYVLLSSFIFAEHSLLKSQSVILKLLEPSLRDVYFNASLSAFQINSLSDQSCRINFCFLNNRSNHKSLPISHGNSFY